MSNTGDVFSAFGLTVDQTEILYNMQRLRVLYDISNEKNEQKANLKRKWLEKYEAGLQESFRTVAPEGRSLTWYPEDELAGICSDRLRQNSISRSWYYLSLFESDIFEAYYPIELAIRKTKLGKEKQIPEKTFDGLKLSSNLDWVSDFAHRVGVIEKSFVPRMRETYKKSISRYSGTKNKVVISSLAVIAVTAATMGTASLFAGPIAVAIAGSNFAGLYGAALTNASLAYLGGGAIAVGGAGIAGGAATVAGGAAVLGLTASSLGAVGINVILRRDVTISNVARVEVVLKEIVLNSQKDTLFAQEVLKSLNDQIMDLSGKLAEAEINLAATKKELQEYKASLDTLKKAYQEMRKFISSFEEGISFLCEGTDKEEGAE